MKKVTLSIKLDSTFVNLLNVSVQLGQLRKKDQLTAIEQLALVVLGEARGALPEQIHATILSEWRPNIEVLHDARVVEVVT